MPIRFGCRFCNLARFATSNKIWLLYIRMTRRQVSALEASQKKAEAAQRSAEKARAEMEFNARTDGMTKLWNRLEIQSRIEKAFVQYQDNGIGFSLVMADIDHFKNVNDTYGHQEGDVVIKALADILQKKEKEDPSRQSAGRWGGEEFMFLSIGLRKKNAAQLAEEIRRSFEDQAFTISGHHTASLGVTEVHPDDTVDTLLARADEALYASKKNGRNQVTLR